MEDLGCFIIHLDRATARAPQVERLCQSLPMPVQVISAVDGAQLSREEIGRYRRSMLRPSYPFKLRLAEIATFLSHRKCWQAILDQDLAGALILEDDVALDEPDFSRAFAAAEAQMRDGDLLRFPVKLREKPAKVLSEGPRVMVPQAIGLGMVGQIVTRKAARILLARTESFDRSVDTYLQMGFDHGLRVLSIWPSGLREISASLGGSLIGRRKGLRERLEREILRPLYRAQLSLHLRLHEARG